MNFYLKIMFRMTIIFKVVLTCFGNSQNNYPIQPQPYQENVVKVISPKPPKPGWKDPFDMLGNTDHEALFVQSDVEVHVLQQRCSSYQTYLRRFVNLFLNTLPKRDSATMDSLTYVTFEFIITGNEINTLQQFGGGEINDAKIEEVSNIFSKIFSQHNQYKTTKSSYNISNFFEWVQKGFLKIISSPEWTILSTVLLMFVTTLWFIYHTHSYRLAIFTLLLTIFLGGFGVTWMRMIEEKEIERFDTIQKHGMVPRHCSRDEFQNMAWYEHIYYRMFGIDCKEFYIIRDLRPISKVSPVVVLAETFSSMIIKPASHIGKAYGTFVTNMLDPLPVWLKPFAVPICFIVPSIFFFICLAFMFNYQASLSITGFHIFPSLPSVSNSRVDRSMGNQYVEDCRREETSISQESNNQIQLDSDKPLFVMNWKGLKKLSSSNLLREKKEEDRKEDVKVPENGIDQSSEEENKQMLENLKDFEKFVQTIESQKAIEERRKRSVHTVSEGRGCLTFRRNSQEAVTIENIDTSGDGISNNTSTEKDLRDKVLK